MPDPLPIQDGDRMLIGVNNRLAPRQLEPGYVADALNRMFDRGVARNRWTVLQPAWGGLPNNQVVNVTSTGGSRLIGFDLPAPSVVPMPSIGSPGLGYGNVVISSTADLTVDAENVSVDAVDITVDAGGHAQLLRPAVSTMLSGQAVIESGFPTAFPGPIVGMGQFADPEFGRLMLLVAVNAPRSDGGQGRVYALQAGPTAIEVSMNGHDFESSVRFIQAFNGMVMLRHGPAVWTFNGNLIESNWFTLRVPIPFPSGTRVQWQALDNSADPGRVKTNTHYFARVSSNQISLHASRADALAGTDPITLGTMPSASRYCIRRADEADHVDNPERNNGMPLIMQPTDANREAVSAGFDAVPTQLFVTDADADADTLRVPVHRFLPGDAVTISDVSGITGLTAGAYYCSVVNPNSIRVHAQQLDALAGVNPVDITAVEDPEATIRKTAANGAPIVPGREGCYFQNRLLLLYGRDLLAVSDVLDPLHYMPFASEFRLNAGTDDRTVALVPFNETTIIVFKERSVLAIENIYGDLSQVRLTEITREFGCVAPLSVVATGSDLLFLSQRGVCSLQQTTYGLTQSVLVPLSDPIQDYIELIDWTRASSACAAFHSNCYLLSVPCKDVASRTLVYSFLNKAWQGRWEGSMLQPLAYAQLVWGGEPTLVFADASRRIHMFGRGKFDQSCDGTQLHIATRLLTRGYAFGLVAHKQFNQVDVLLSSWMPLYSVRAIFDGVNEAASLVRAQSADRTKYLSYGRKRYAADNRYFDFFRPFRRDYSVPAGWHVMTSATEPDQHRRGVSPGMMQTVLQKMSLQRRHGDTVQLDLTCTQGELAIKSLAVEGADWSSSMRRDN